MRMHSSGRLVAVYSHGDLLGNGSGKMFSALGIYDRTLFRNISATNDGSWQSVG